MCDVRSDGFLDYNRASFVMKKLSMKKTNSGANSVKTLERDLKVASSILEWEMGDIWGHGQIDSSTGRRG
jgi:hypothetical protein